METRHLQEGDMDGVRLTYANGKPEIGAVYYFVNVTPRNDGMNPEER